MTIAIACGWRRLYTGAEWWPLLDEARESYRITEVWHGGCEDGADVVVALWAKARGLRIEAFPAPWELFKQAKIPAKAAGPRRIDDMLAGRRGYTIADVAQIDASDQQAPLALPERAGEDAPRRRSLITTEQLEGRPEVLLALPGYAGTRRTIRAAEAAGLMVARLSFEPWVANKWHYRDRDGSYRFPPDAIDIQRGSPIGNPFRVGDMIDAAIAVLGRDAVATVLGRAPRSDDQITSDTCLALYRAWLMRQIRERDRGVMRALQRIGPKSVLMCTCKRPDGTGLCHGDVVVRCWRWLNGRRQPDAPGASGGGGSPETSDRREHDTTAA
jgi:hypothetical protein